MILKELLERSEYTLVQGSEDVEISTLVYDSRKIEKGSVFVCISGAAFDGHKFCCIDENIYAVCANLNIGQMVH